jgi:hypothetical protein
MPIHKIEIEYPFGAPAPNIHCPICGAAVSKMNEEITQPACEHVEYVYLADIAEFEYIRPNLQVLIDQWDASPIADATGTCDEEQGVVEALCSRRDSKTKVALGLVTGGMACGPFWYSVWFGFDLGPHGCDARGCGSASPQGSVTARKPCVCLPLPRRGS